MSATADQILVSAYGDFADYYDRFTADHDYDRWVAVIERLARRHGWRGRELIDAACGTGKSFLPWARRGFRVRGFDRSEQMLRLAQAKCEAEGLPVELCVHDLRAPARIEPAPLVTCLDDVLNYQLTGEDLDAVVGGLAGLLAPGGLAIFDTNSRLTYRTSYTRTGEVNDGDLTMCWEGRQDVGGAFEGTITVREHGDAVLQSCHRQRFWPADRVEEAVRRAGMQTVAVYGMSRDGSTSQPADDACHTKFLYVVTR
jgi:SAM-dependent methyltransferase